MYKIILALRYLLRRRITYFAVLAVALCVFIVVVVMTVMTGLVRDFKQKNHQFVGDCVVGTESLVGFAYYEDFMNMLEGADFIEGVSPVIKNYALLNPMGTERTIGVEIMGIDPVRHSRVSGFGSMLHYRKDDVSKAFVPSYDSNLPGCVIGIDLVLSRDSDGRYYYGAAPIEMGVAVSCFPLTAKGSLAKAGAGLVNTKTFYYSDTSHSGLARVDSSLVYLPFEESQVLCGMSGRDKRASWLHIKFKPNVKLEDGCKQVALLWRKFAEERSGERQAELLSTVVVQSWKDYRRAFIAAMEKEQTMMTVMFALVGLTTVFIVFVVFYMIVSHKSKDIGILKSIGVSNRDIIRLFSGFSFLVGVLGSGVGVICGWVFLLRINQIEDWLYEQFKFQLWDRTIYVIGDIPNQVEFSVLAVIVLSAIVACLAGAFVPSWQAARLEPVETLQVSRL
ncbi:MAG: ABC transporter permease [Planctomycetota bacterium]|nr:MAG: ABC transporter permease [Planctomycetota bacterium]